MPKSASDSAGFGKSGSGATGGAKPKFGTLNTLSKDSSDEEEGQAFYAGGSERSGQQVLGSPKRKNNMRERLTDLFKMAQAELSERPASSSSGGRSWGMGLRLGQPGDPEETRPTVNASSSSDTDIQTVILKLWRQGFSINDGELRPYDQPQNKIFLETVMRG